jgi:DNA-binding NarL/FixJ family response regulator
MFVHSEIEIAVVAADSLVRAGLSSILSNHEGLIVSEACSPLEAAAWRDSEVDVVVWDYDDEPVESDSPVLLLVAEDSEVQGLMSGAVAGIILRSADSEQLVAAIAAVAQGLMVIEPSLVSKQLLQQSQPQVVVDDLTPREFEVLSHLCEGLSNKAIAKALDISDHTVKFHINALMSKFEVHNRTELVVQALQAAIVAL